MKFTRKGWVFGRYLFTTLNQAGSAPLLDRGFSFTEDGREFEGRCLLLTPWRRNQHGESVPQLALFVGRQVAPSIAGALEYNHGWTGAVRGPGHGLEAASGSAEDDDDKEEWLRGDDDEELVP